MKKSKTIKFYGLIGYPVEHSISPWMHNAAFNKLGINAVYILLPVKPEDLYPVIKILKDIGISGFNITIPFKTRICKYRHYLDECDESARRIGAVNTVVNRNGRLKGYNTDSTGFLQSLKKDLHLNPKGKSCHIVGAGGAGRAVAFALAGAGAREIYITDILKKRADNLRKDLQKHFSRCKLSSGITRTFRPKTFHCDLLVNASPVGMKENKCPIDTCHLRNYSKVYDVVYNPSPTRLVAEARKRGIEAQDGLGMLLYQGAEAFKLWTGKKAPIGIMRKAISQHI